MFFILRITHAFFLVKKKMRKNVTPQLWEFNFHPGLYKIKTNGLMPTIDAVFAKPDTPLPLGYCNVSRIAEIGSSVQSNSMVGNRVVIPYFNPLMSG